MDHARITHLLEPYLGSANDQRPTANDLNHISTYIDILLRWNARINLTAVRTEEEIVTRHFGESFFAATHLFPERLAAEAEPVQASTGNKAAERRENSAHGVSHGFATTPDQAPEERKSAVVQLADLGSGAGFPGIPIKLWAPHIHITLIESNSRKAAFLREVVRALTLTDIDIQNTRAESLAGHLFDAVTLRAVERFEAILPTAATLLAPGGRLALLISAAQLKQAQTALPTLRWAEPSPIPMSRSRIVALAYSS